MLPRAQGVCRLLAFALAIPLILAGCDAGTGGQDSTTQLGFDLDNCTIPSNQLVDGTGGRGRDAIPSLSNPGLTQAGTEGASYLADSDRVIGLLFGDVPIAVPHNVLWFHEIINFDGLAGTNLTVTYCPLTGSSLAFDRSAVDGAKFGVSGLLFNNNLLMYDRRNNESLWPQMNRQANCGTNVGAELDMLPVIEMTWGEWKELHPDTKVVSSEETGYAFSYTNSNYPYGADYEDPENGRLLFDMQIDDRRPPKERLLGIPAGNDGGMALPFGELSDGPGLRTIEVTAGGQEVVVLWNATARGAMAYRPTLDGQSLTFSVEDGDIIDDQTGSTWTLDGRAVEGPEAGNRLEPVGEAYVSFWFAWAAFHPNTRIWTQS